MTKKKKKKKEQPSPLDEKIKRFDFKVKIIDLLLKVFIPIITVTIGLWQFYNQQDSQERTRFKTEFWLKKFDMYTSLSEAIADLNVAIEKSASDDSIRLRKEAFEILYWKSTLVEDSTLTEALINFNDSLDLYFEIPDKERTEMRRRLPQQGNSLIKLCRESLSNKNF